MNTASDLLKNLTNFLKTEEGRKSIEEFSKKMKAEDDRRSNNIERFKKYAEHRLDEVLEKIVTKYDSDEYVRREYSLGYEPRETLLWVAFGYATEYCKPCDDPEYANYFTGTMYYIGSYVIQIMYGQGSVIKIEKIK
jgi:hypothetical protein